MDRFWRDGGIPFKNNCKYLDPSYKTDLDFLGKYLDPSYKTDLDFWVFGIENPI